MTEPLTRKELDEAVITGCNYPSCDHRNGFHQEPLFFHARCHPHKNPEVSYQAGLITLKCSLCGLIICDVRVATT